MRRRFAIGLLAAVIGLAVVIGGIHIAVAQVFVPAPQNPMFIQLPFGLTIEFGGPTASIAGGGTLVITYPRACTLATLATALTPAAAVTLPSFVSAVSATGLTLNNQGTAAATFYWWAICF